MGDRGNVHVKGQDVGEPGVYLYTHWYGSELPNTVAHALDRGRDRWTDGSYLARIIFCEMVKGVESQTDGYGIACFEVDENHPTIEVDVDLQTVDGLAFETYVASRLAGV